MQCREDHAAGCHLQQFLHFTAIIGLHRLLPQQFMATGERAEELVVQVVAVGDNHQRRICHLGMPNHFAGVEGHRQTLSASLRVPNDANAAIPFRRNRLQCAIDRLVHRVELVIASHLLDDRSGIDFEDDEVLEQVQKPFLLKHALYEDIEFRLSFRGDLFAVRRPPRHEAVPARR